MNRYALKICEKCRLQYQDFADSVNGLCLYCREKMTADEWREYIDAKSNAYIKEQLGGVG